MTTKYLQRSYLAPVSVSCHKTQSLCELVKQPIALSVTLAQSIYNNQNKIRILLSYYISQWAYGAKMTSYERRCDVITSHRR